MHLISSVFIVVTILAVVFGQDENKTQETDNKRTGEILEHKDDDTQELLDWEAPIEIQNDIPYYLSGYDDEMAPIWVAEMGLWDARKYLEMGPESEKMLKKYILQFLKRCKESIKLKSTPENPVNEFSLIIDMEGYSYRQATNRATISFTLWLATEIEKAFRGTVKFGFFVNGNYLFTSVWQLLKPIFGANVSKVDVFGNNSQKFIPRLLRVFPRDQLSEKYGGTKGHKPIKVYN